MFIIVLSYILYTLLILVHNVCHCNFNFFVIFVFTFDEKTFICCKLFSETNYSLVKKNLSPLFLTDNIKLDGIPSKIKWKIHAFFYIASKSLQILLMKSYMTQLGFRWVLSHWPYSGGGGKGPLFHFFHRNFYRQRS